MPAVLRKFPFIVLWPQNPEIDAALGIKKNLLRSSITGVGRSGRCFPSIKITNLNTINAIYLSLMIAYEKDHERHWEAWAKTLVKTELKRRDVTYDQLSAKLKDLGVDETPAAIANKISRGRFTFVFFLQCLKAVGASVVRLDP